MILYVYTKRKGVLNMLELSRVIFTEAIEELKNLGFEDETFFNKDSEFHEEAYKEVEWFMTQELVEALLDKATEQLDETETGNLLWKMIYNNVQDEAEKQVYEVIAKFY